MRAYVPIPWPDLAELSRTGQLPGPRTAVAVDPAWRAGAPSVTEEEWEYEAQSESAAALSAMGGGVVLALDVPDAPAELDDGRLVLPGPVERARVQALFTEDLAWFAVQEAPDLLAGR